MIVIATKGTTVYYKLPSELESIVEHGLTSKTYLPSGSVVAMVDSDSKDIDVATDTSAIRADKASRRMDEVNAKIAAGDFMDLKQFEVADATEVGTKTK